LRNRAEDIGLLARRFLHLASRELGLDEKRLRKDTLSVMEKFHWPGNVRQLQNVCRQLSVMAPAEVIFPEDLPEEIFSTALGKAVDLEWPDGLRRWAKTELRAGGEDLVNRAQAELERVLIECALEQTGGQRIRAAELLGLGRNTLTRKLKHMGDPAAETKDDIQPQHLQVAGRT
jgi:two-component system nitrogen regulation response regulator GlnG